MAFIKTIAAAAVLCCGAGAALAWDDAYKGDATHNPNSNVLMHSYPTAANYCPAGLQPVTMGGVICCGEPNAGPYVNRAGGHKRVHKAKSHVYHAPRAYAPAGEKGVVYR
ncbi:hypothetical protein DU478_13230 [Thalassococcus profundi]|uniref:DUF3551 domain-containing protein n=1 Tax=Thalassococcus profundi TaxID=2282382 RepID=A0A369TKK7_9RHOB|nr:hypothetical protein [Thalassococcus profundi]RDD65871.1 hypothetical protein DU478_13230 [Thalassococcus profundi]